MQESENLTNVVEYRFNEFFQIWFSKVTAMLNEHQTKWNQFREISYTEGKRYNRITVGGSAWAFVDRTTGAVLKPASYRAPAKHARGNIFDGKDIKEYLTEYGPMHLKVGRR